MSHACTLTSFAKAPLVSIEDPLDENDWGYGP